MTRVWHPPDPDDLVRRYQAGETTVTLAAHYNVNRHALADALRVLGVELRPRGRPATRPADLTLIARYNAGESILSIARDLGVSRGQITERLRRAGVPLRGVGQQSENSISARCRSALTSELRQSGVGKHEEALSAALAQKGYQTAPQRAVGPYNIDVAVLPVAVEVLGADWQLSPEKRTLRRERVEYLFDAGWSVIELLIRARESLKPAAVEKIIAFIEQTRSDPPSRREYRVIRGNGHDATTSRTCFD